MDIKQAFFDNLLMLDFDPIAMSAKYCVTFSKDMFVVPNQRAFQYVAHFLFQRLDKTMADEAFRHCWPVGDKRAEAEFRKKTCDWLAELASNQDDDMAMPLPRIVPSLFMSPGGDKFYYLMFTFSRLALVRISMREWGIKPHQLVKPPNFAMLSKDSPIGYQTFLSVGHAMVAAEKSQFLQELQQLNAEQRKWSEAADRYVATYRSALRADKGCEENLKGELETAAQEGARLAGLGQWSRRFRSAAPVNTGTPGSSAAGGRMAQRAVAERFRKFWRRIEDLWNNGQSTVQILSDCLSDRGGPNGESLTRLDGSTIIVRLPDILVRRLEELVLSNALPEDVDEDSDSEDSQAIKMSSILPIELYDRGRLNLVAVVRFVTLALNLYSEQLAAFVANGDFSSLTESLTAQLPSDCRYLKQMIVQIREAKKNGQKVHEHLHQRVLRMLDNTIYRLPATISSLSTSKESNEEHDSELSPSFFTTKSSLNNEVLSTPGYLPNEKTRKHCPITPGFLDLSSGHAIDLVPMTPLTTVTAESNKPLRKQIARVPDENDGEDLLIDLTEYSR